MSTVRIEPHYQKIAYIIAKRITEKELLEGDKLSGRSMLASQFNVSSETVRKAMRLLSDFGVVDVQPQSGIRIISHAGAQRYVDHYQNKRQEHKILQDTYQLLEQSKQQFDALERHMKILLNAYKRDIFPFEYFTVTLNRDSRHLGSSLSSLDFYRATRGQIIAVEKQVVFTQAPDPTISLETGMVLYILGDEIVREKTLSFFNI